MRVGPGQFVRGLDLSDDVQVGRRRTLVIGVFNLIGLVAGLVSFVQVRNGMPPLAGSVVAAPAQILVCGVAGWRRERLGDPGFLGLLVLTVCVMVPNLFVSTPVGSLRSAELMLMGPPVIAAVYCGTRWHTALVAALSVAGAGAVTLHRLSGLPGAVSEVVAEVVMIALIVLLVRNLRDSARVALLASRHGELIDPLTGLLNRRGFERSGCSTWGRLAADRRPVAFLVLDVDHFKQVNDTLGHAAGDELLRRLAAVLRSSLRRDDVAVRLGGEEFAVLAPTDPGEGQRIAERLRRRIQEELGPVTVSIGVVEAVPEPGDPPRTLDALWHAAERADRGLYEAKRAGRNRVVVVPAESPPAESPPAESPPAG